MHVRFAKDQRLERLRELVRDEVSGGGLLAGAYRRLHAKAAAVVVWALVSYWMLVVVTPWWWPVCLLSFVLAGAAVAFNVMHDGNHQAFSRRRGVNRLAGLTLDVLGGSSLFWLQDHNGNHHDAPNVDPCDGDIQYGSLARVSPAQPWRPWFRFQHYYMWLMYAFIPQRWQFYLDFRKMMRGQGLDGSAAYGTRRQYWILLAGKIAFLGWAFVLPALLHPLWCVVAVYGLGSALGGVVLATVLQLAHCVEGAKFISTTDDRPRLGETWLQVQVEATRNVRLPRWLSWYVGGLDYQIEHHLFPRYPHTVYRRLAPGIERFCRENRITYETHPTLGRAMAAHFHWLRRMGQPPRPRDDERLAAMDNRSPALTAPGATSTSGSPATGAESMTGTDLAEADLGTRIAKLTGRQLQRTDR